MELSDNDNDIKREQDVIDRHERKRDKKHKHKKDKKHRRREREENHHLNDKEILGLSKEQLD